MGKDSEEGVVDTYGSVFWNDGSSVKTKTLYHVASSILPASLWFFIMFLIDYSSNTIVLNLLANAVVTF